MTKKVLAFLLVLVFSAGFFAACTPENPGSTDTNTNSVSANSDTDTEKQNTSLTNSGTDTEKTDISVNQNTSSQTDTNGNTSSQTDITQSTSSADTEEDTTDSGEIPEFEKIYNENLTVEAEFEDNSVLVIFMPNAYGKEYTVQDFEEIGCIEIHRNYKLNLKHPETGKSYPATYLHLILDKHSKENVLNVVRILEQWPTVRSAGVNFYYETAEAPMAEPTDPKFVSGDQWALRKIDLHLAWEYYTTSAASVLIGVIDSGVYPAHDDLNDGQINMAKSVNFREEGSQTLSDFGGHGTHVTGIIGATANNGVGISGVCWDSQIAVFQTGQGYTGSNGKENLDTGDIIDSFKIAEQNGVDILNCSFGLYYYDSSMYAVMSQFSGLIVCAAGNDGKDVDVEKFYPACYPLDNIICVGATDSSDAVWSVYDSGDGRFYSSNYGDEEVDVFAPGSNILSCFNNGSYMQKSGTSMAAPFVTGVAALMLSINPDLSPLELKTMISSNGTIVSGLSGKCVYGERLNANYALSAARAAHNHNYVYTSISDVMHRGICFPCGHQVVGPHKGTCHSEGSTGHYMACDTCGFNGTCSHRYNYESIDEVRHLGTCRQCGYQTIEIHSGNCYSLGNTSHYLKCQFCYLEGTYSHSLTETGDTRYCLLCEYSINYMGIKPKPEIE